MRRKHTGLLQYLEARLGSHSGYGPEYQFFCPFCIDRRGDESDQRKLRMNIAKGKCKCFRCDYGAGDLEKLFRDLNGGTLRVSELLIIKGEQKPPEQAKIKEAIQDILYAKQACVEELKPYELPPYCIPLNQETKKDMRVRQGWNYLTKIRKIHERIIDTFDIRYCYKGKYEERLIFPVHQGGEIVYWTNRACNNYAMKSLNPKNQEGYYSKDTVLLNYDNLIGMQTVCICEGAFDMFAMRNACAVGGKIISEVQINLITELARHGTKEVVIALDSDATKSAERIYNRLLGRFDIVSILNLDYGDPDERKDEMKELMKNRGALSIRDKVKCRLNR